MAVHPRVVSPSRTPPKPTRDITLKDDKIEDLLKLQAALEKEVVKSFHSKDQCLQSSFVSFEEALTHQRNTEYFDLRQHIKQIKNSVSHFKRTLQDNKNGPKFVEKVKQSLEDIEASILSFKENQRQTYEQLLKEEITVYQEVLAYERRIESWLTSNSSKKTNLGVPERSLASTNMPPAVLAFERFLSQTGGHTGGWEEFDHLTFVRIKRKHHGGESFFSAVKTEIPTRSLEEIKQHDNWYTGYCSVLEAKKTAIAEWKNEKQKQTCARMEDENEEPHASPIKQNVKEILFQKEKEERLSKLKEWKAETLKRQKEEERMKEETMREKQRVMKQKELERQSLVKAELEKYSKLKDEKNKKKRQEDEMKSKEEKQRSKVANKQIQKFRERDALSLKGKLERVSIQEQEQIERDKRLDKLRQTVAVNVSRDPSRLLRPTTGWKERKKAEEEHHEHSGSILQVTRRAVPNWRQGL